MWGHRFIAAIVVLASLAFIAGCGDNGGSETSANGDMVSADGKNSAATTDGQSSASGPRAEFIEQATAICTKRSEELKAKGEKFFKEAYDEPELVVRRKAASQVIIPIFEAELRELRELDIPPVDAAQVGAIYAAIEDMLKSVRELRKTYPYTETEKLSRRYGITPCGHPK